MKTILIATDFSPTAKNAADYAAQLSKTTSSSLVLFHSFSLPPMAGDTIVLPISIDELEGGSNLALNQEAKRLQKLWKVKVEVKQKMGFASDEIGICARECSAQLVVLGMQPQNKINRFLGNVTTSFLHKNQFPTLIIPENVPYKHPSIFLFATDLHSEVNLMGFNVLIELVGNFGGGIHVLNVVREKQIVNAAESRVGIILEEQFKNFPHHWHFPNDGNVVHAISKTANEISADWIAVVPHKLPWFKQLFHHSVSNELAFSTNYPILALPEESPFEN